MNYYYQYDSYESLVICDKMEISNQSLKKITNNMCRYQTIHNDRGITHGYYWFVQKLGMNPRKIGGEQKTSHEISENDGI